MGKWHCNSTSCNIQNEFHVTKQRKCKQQNSIKFLEDKRECLHDLMKRKTLRYKKNQSW